MSVEQYFNRGRKRIDSNDYYGAIADYNKAISFGRGIQYKTLEDGTKKIIANRRLVSKYPQ